MPVPDRPEAIRRMKAAPKERETKIAALTASGLEEERAERLWNLADDFEHGKIAMDTGTRQRAKAGPEMRTPRLKPARRKPIFRFTGYRVSAPGRHSPPSPACGLFCQDNQP